MCLDGATLPGGKTIRTGKLRGELSEGMLCGGSELGVDDALYPGAGVDGILVLREEYPLGVDVRPLLGLGDTVVDFDILANRPDCLCMWGVARESAAAFDVPFVKPEIAVTEHGGDIRDEARVEVLDSELCPRYAARVVKNVRIGPSPMWMRAYLHAAGMRSINNIVDITNFVMLETGHPMHAFDLGRVAGRHIVVRRARPAETLRTLDGKNHVLREDMLVIADAEHATGLAGIMGGEESEITENTKEILFECAAFDRASTRVTAARWASARSPPPALKKAFRPPRSWRRWTAPASSWKCWMRAIPCPASSTGIPGRSPSARFRPASRAYAA